MYGLNYGLSNDPTRQDYWKYNRTDKTTDFSYLRLQSDLSSNLSLDNRVYMYGYTNNTMSGNTSTVVTGFFRARARPPRHTRPSPTPARCPATTS